MATSRPGRPTLVAGTVDAEPGGRESSPMSRLANWLASQLVMSPTFLGLSRALHGDLRNESKFDLLGTSSSTIKSLDWLVFYQ